MDKVLTVRNILHVFVEPGKLEDVGEALTRIPEIIDIYEVTEEYDLIATAKANDLHKLRSVIQVCYHGEADEDVWSEGSR